MIESTSNNRPISMLLNIYKNPQKGECDSARHYTKKEQRMYERLKYADYVAGELDIQHYARRIKYIIKNIDNFKTLCGVCKWETIIIAIAFYVKCYNTRTRASEISRYKICKENELTIVCYATIVTRLAYQFSTVEALSPLCPIKE